MITEETSEWLKQKINEKTSGCALLSNPNREDVNDDFSSRYSKGLWSKLMANLQVYLKKLVNELPEVPQADKQTLVKLLLKRLQDLKQYMRDQWNSHLNWSSDVKQLYQLGDTVASMHVEELRHYFDQNVEQLEETAQGLAAQHLRGVFAVSYRLF